MSHYWRGSWRKIMFLWNTQESTLLTLNCGFSSNIMEAHLNSMLFVAMWLLLLWMRHWMSLSFQELDRLVERGSRASIDPKADDGGEEEGVDSIYIYCVTCGHEVQARRAVRHMENCFNKVIQKKMRKKLDTLKRTKKLCISYVCLNVSCAQLLVLIYVYLFPAGESDHLWLHVQDKDRGKQHVLWLLQLQHPHVL